MISLVLNCIVLQKYVLPHLRLADTYLLRCFLLGGQGRRHEEPPKFKMNLSACNTLPSVSQHSGYRSCPRLTLLVELHMVLLPLIFPQLDTLWHCSGFPGPRGTGKIPSIPALPFLCFDKAPTVPSMANALLRWSLKVNLFQRHQSCGFVHVALRIVSNYLCCISAQEPLQYQGLLHSAQGTRTAANAWAWLTCYSKVI